MIDMTVPVTAEWALWGKEAHDAKYRVLECSAGPVSRENFAEALSRFSPGSLDKLPQVTISWLPGQGSYLAIAFHDLPERGRYDAHGREIAPTRYFCVPFRQLAAGAVSYLAMFAGFERIMPQSGDRSPISTKLAARQPGAAPGMLAVRVAALLLTGRRVRVVGAEATDLGERLRFLDDVVSLLPYGMRSRLSSSTWVGHISEGHKLRLFFSSHSDRRGNHEPGDQEVTWGDDEAVPTGDQFADDYMRWLLADIPGRVDRLAQLTEPMPIGDPDTMRQLLSELGVALGHAAHLERLYSRKLQDLRETARRLIPLAVLLGRLHADARLEREVRRAIADIDDAVQQEVPGPGMSGVIRDIRDQQAAVDHLADLASRASWLADEVKAAVTARYEASLREMREAREKLASLKVLAEEEGARGELGRAAELLGAEMDEVITASHRLREMITHPAPDPAALETAMHLPSALTSRAQHMIRSIFTELLRFSVLLSYPKIVCAGISSNFLVQIFLPHQQRTAEAEVREVFKDTAPAKVGREARLQLGIKVGIRLSSPAMDFSENVQKVISLEGANTTFQGIPKPSAPPGTHAAVLAISDERGEQELLSIPFDVKIADYAFDHVSRPVAGRLVGGIVGAVSLCVFSLALITRTAQVLGAAGGGIGLAASAFVFTMMDRLYRRTISVQGSSQDPPSR